MERPLTFKEAKEAARRGEIGLRIRFPKIMEDDRTIQPAAENQGPMVTHVVPGIYQPVDLTPYKEVAEAIEAARERS